MLVNTSSVIRTCILSHSNLNIIARTAIQILFVNDSSMPPPEQLNEEMRHAYLLRGIEQHRH